MATPGLILHLLLLASSSSQSLDTFIDQALINEQNAMVSTFFCHQRQNQLLTLRKRALRDWRPFA